MQKRMVVLARPHGSFKCIFITVQKQCDFPTSLEYSSGNFLTLLEYGNGMRDRLLVVGGISARTSGGGTGGESGRWEWGRRGVWE